MSVLLRLVAVVLVLGPAAACSSFGGGGEPETVVEAAPVVAPVEEVRGIEIGRTRDGIVVTAFGLAPGLGYANPRLEARRGGRPAEDGFLDFDFVATAPDPQTAMPAGLPQARLLRADRLIVLDAARRAAGLRIHAARGGRAIAF